MYLTTFGFAFLHDFASCTVSTTDVDLHSLILNTFQFNKPVIVCLEININLPHNFHQRNLSWQLALDRVMKNYVTNRSAMHSYNGCLPLRKLIQKFFLKLLKWFLNRPYCNSLNLPWSNHFKNTISKYLGKWSILLQS